MRMLVSEGSEPRETQDRVEGAVGQPLSDQETEAILRRLPPMQGSLADIQEFRLPPETLPAPRPGETITQTFPPSEALEPPEPEVQGPLHVLRYSPEGAVDLAPMVSVTFDQPMVALTSHSELSELQVPVELTPLPSEGSWHWVGTKTLVFQAAGRLPQATRYTVRIPAGTQSAVGGMLENEVAFAFETPAPRVVAAHPGGGPQVRNPILFVSFDQRVDPEAVLAKIRLEASGTSFPLRLATPEEISADQSVADLVRAAVDGRWLAFRPLDDLPYDAQVDLIVGPGVPSLEGPLTSDAGYLHQFQTYGPMKVVESRCGWGGECRPGTAWSIRFSNTLDEESFSEEQVTIVPALTSGQISVNGTTLTIHGSSVGSTTYRVTLGSSIRDVFGQTMGREETVRFEVGQAAPFMAQSGQSMIVIDPAGKPSYTVFTTNYGAVSLKAYTASIEDWPAWQSYLQEASRKVDPTEPPGRRVLDTKIAVESPQDTMVATTLDLAQALGDRQYGHLILVITPESPLAPLPKNYHKPVIRIWVQVTNIGLDAFVDGQKMLAWANALSDGAPLAGVSLAISGGSGRTSTGTDGVGTLALPSSLANDPRFLAATLEQDSAFLPETYYWWGYGSWNERRHAEDTRWYVFDDRGIYRPGETVHVKGWVRIVGLSEGADIFRLPKSGSLISYKLQDSRGNALLEGTATLNAWGAFDTRLILPETMNLGSAQLALTLSDAGSGTSTYGHSIQVQEFRRPEFEVQARMSQGPHFARESATATVSASYYAGGPLQNAPVNWTVTAAATNYRPPGWDQFEFGFWEPWWRGVMGFEPSLGRQEVSVHSGVTDGSGQHHLRIEFSESDPPRPQHVTAEGAVTDVNRQQWAASATTLVHPAELYVGLRTERTFYERGQPMLLEAIVTDLDGKPVVDRPIEVRAVRLEWKYSKGKWLEVEVAEQRLSLGSSSQPVSGTLSTPEGGTYRITASIVDGQGRSNVTQLTRWVSGGIRPSSDRVEQEEVTLIPDRKEYRPGDTAEILVQSPFAPAEGLLTLRRGGIVSSERFSMASSTYTLRVPITEAHIPNLAVQVDLVGAASRLNELGVEDSSLPKRAAYAEGSLELAVPPLLRTLAVEVLPRSTEVEPGGETVLDVGVTDAAGLPVVGAELAVVVVDDAVLALTAYELDDPISVFYRSRDAGVTNYHSRQYIVLAEPEDFDMVAGVQEADGMLAAPVMGMMPTRSAMSAEAKVGLDMEEAATPIQLRSDFNPLALFAPSVATDALGQAAIAVKVPDNLTRYRVMVVAVYGEKYFGKGEAAITARLPLMVRPSAPRFLNFGDRFELPVVVQNQTDAAMQVEVVVRTSNALLVNGAGQRINVPAHDRREVRFAVATDRVGTARFQVGAVSGAWADAAEFSLPVYTPATTEAFAVYGTLDHGAVAQPILVPGDAFSQFGGLEVQASSTALQALTDAALYLIDYPFECSEQLASRLLAVAALRDVLSAFSAEGLPTEQELVAAVQRDLERLTQLQNSDGGFPIWQQGRESWPFHSIHAVHALLRAKSKGWTVDQTAVDRGMGYLSKIESHFTQSYSEDVRNTLIAYSLYVRALAGDRDLARGRRLMQEQSLSRMQPEAIGFLLALMSGDPGSVAELAEIRRYLANSVVETAGAANFVSSYREQDGYLLLASGRRADGIILEALVGDQPENDLIPKLVNGLLAHRKAGRWGSTQENVFVLLALDRYFRTYEAVTPEFVARVWLGNQYLAGFNFVGRSTEYEQVKVPMGYLVQAEPGASLLLSKEGPGRLYYRLGMSYAPTSLELEALERGFTVLRTYQAVDDPADVRQEADGVWHVKAGARVRVRLTMVAPSRRYHVALVDPLPAGFEAMNPALAVTPSIPQDEQRPSDRYWWWRRAWYEHQNLRDQRVEAFASLLWDGVHSYTYVARATTPGLFVVPPAKAEEMYAPETFGRSASDRVVIE